MNKDIIRLKKYGKLIAIAPGLQYWIMDDVLYSVSSSGTSFDIWCSVPRLNAHLHRLYQVTGHKFFTDDPSILIIDRPFISRFAYA